jgi:hypothetical protein
MTDIQAKALALLNEVKVERGKLVYYDVINRNHDVVHEALCRAIEQHEAFKQEVSDAAEMAVEAIVEWSDDIDKAEFLYQFIIPKPKPDPLVDVAARLGWDSDYVPVVRATLDFFDLEIREKGQ